MGKIIEDYLVGFGSVRDMERLEEDYYGEFTDAGMTPRRKLRTCRTRYDMPSKKECDRMCAELSGEVKIYKIEST